MKIHYFQRYHSKENVDTANTLLLLSRLYSYSSDKYFKFMKGTLLADDSEPELSFILQEKNSSSVPDATISQKSYKIVIETKLNNNFNLVQLKSHFESFKNEEEKVLLTLDPKHMDETFKIKFEKELEIYNHDVLIKHNLTPIRHKNITFTEIIEEIKAVLIDQDVEMLDVLSDYEDYCYQSSLILDDWKRMRAIAAGTTYKKNIELGLYYDNADRRFSGHKYIGLYTNKSVVAIGELIKIITAKMNKGQVIIEKGEATLEEVNRIRLAIEDARNYGYDLYSEPHNFFIVDRFYETLYKKETPNPIQRAKYFNLTEVLKVENLPDTEVIAELLRGYTW